MGYICDYWSLLFTLILLLSVLWFWFIAKSESQTSEEEERKNYFRYTFSIRSLVPNVESWEITDNFGPATDVEYAKMKRVTDKIVQITLMPVRCTADYDKMNYILSIDLDKYKGKQYPLLNFPEKLQNSKEIGIMMSEVLRLLHNHVYNQVLVNDD